MNHVLSLTNSLDARLNRVDAYVQTQNFDAARADCLDLQKTFPDTHLGEYGLAKIAELQHDTNQAIHYLTICLSNTPPNSVLGYDVRQRLDSFQPHASTKLR